MGSPFKYSDDNKRYHTYSYYLKRRFGQKVFKISLDAGSTCPNRDGTKGMGGCAFCSAKRSGDFAGDCHEPIEVQYKRGIEALKDKWAQGLCIPYFQAGSNTYGDIATLESLYRQALSLENAVGLSIATRADCIDEDTAKLLGEIGESTYLTVELGLQSVFDSTAEAMNRCHTYEDFLKGYELLRRHGVNVCVHIINGLPGETHDMMRQTAREVAKLDIHAVKIHLLHVLKGTRLAEMYEKGEFKAMERDEYIGVVCDQLELLPEDVVIERLTGDGDRNELIAPMWSRDKRRVLNGIDTELARRDSQQGKKYVK